MKNITKNILRILAVLGLFASLATAQTALNSTTLSAAVTGGGPYSGTSGVFQTQVTVASVTNLTAAFNSSVIQSVLYVDREAMGVVSFNSTTKIVQVLRGYMGTPATPHASGATVLYGPINTLGANIFFQSDPSGACTAAATPSTPYVNVSNGLQWLCSSVTGTWVPGFGNPGASQTPILPTAAVASAAGLIVPSGPLFHITGTQAITGFTIPVGFLGGQICVIPDAAFTTTNATNIAIASTGVISKQLCWNFDSATAKFYPSY